MSTRTHNRFTHTFLPTGVALLLCAGSVFAAPSDAQDQARSMLTGVAGEHILFTVVVSDAAQIDPQIQAQQLLGGKPRISAPASSESQTTAAIDVSPSDLARRLLVGSAY